MQGWRGKNGVGKENGWRAFQTEEKKVKERVREWWSTVALILGVPLICPFSFSLSGCASVFLTGMHTGTRQEEVIDHRLTDREWAEEWKHLDHVRKVITFFYYYT